MAKREAERYGMAVVDKYRDNAYDIMSKYNLDTRSQWQKDLDQNQQDFSNYLSSGNYTTENNKKYRDMATAAVADLDEQMKRYGSNSNERKYLNEYKTYYENALPNFDRMDVGATMHDYLSYDPKTYKYTNWHSEEDYNNQKTYIDDQRKALQAEMDELGETESDSYKTLKSWMDQYDMLADALEDRNKYDRQFETPEAYASYERAQDYTNNVQTRKQKDKLQAQLADAEDTYKRLQPKFYGITDIGSINPEEQKEYEDLLAAERTIAKLKPEVVKLTGDLAGIEKYQKDEARGDYYREYGLDGNVQERVDSLKAAREKAEQLHGKDSTEWAKIDLQIRALAGEKENGTNENGLYDESTPLGRYIMSNFNVEEAEEEIAKIDKQLQDLGAPSDQVAGRLIDKFGFLGAVGTGMNHQQFGAGATIARDVGEAKALEDDPRVMELRAQKAAWQQKINSSDRLKERNRIDGAYEKLQNKDALAEEGAGLILQDGKGALGHTTYQKPGAAAGESGDLGRYFSYLNDEALAGTDWEDMASSIRSKIYAAIAAENKGVDIGYTVEDVLNAYEGNMAAIAGYLDAKKINDTEGSLGRFLKQEGFLLGGAAWNNLTHVGDMFTDEVKPANRLENMQANVLQNMGEYGGIGGLKVTDERNLAQTIGEATWTTGNMLPSIAASYLMSGGLRALGAGATAAKTAGRVAGASMMGLTSGGQAYQQALAEGWSKEDARLYGTIIGAAEVGTQYAIGGITGLGGITEDKLLAMCKGIDHVLPRVIAETGIHIGSEVAEELVQNRIERYLQYDLFREGNEDWMSWTDDDWYTVVVTALSTGAMEGPGTAYSLAMQNRTGKALSGAIIPGKGITRRQQANNAITRAVGEMMQGNEPLSFTLVNIGTDLTEVGSEANEMATKMAEGKLPKNAMNLGELYGLTMAEFQKQDGKNGIDKFMNAMQGGATTYNGIENAKSVRDASKAEYERIKSENPGAVVLDQNATALRNLGINESDAVEYGALMNKILSGEKLTDTEADKVSADTKAGQAIRAALANEIGEFDRTAAPEITKATITAVYNEMKLEKQRQQESLRVSVVQAAMNAANQAEVNRATASTDFAKAQWASESQAYGAGSVLDKAVSKQNVTPVRQRVGYHEATQKAVDSKIAQEMQAADQQVRTAERQVQLLEKMSFEEAAKYHFTGLEGIMGDMKTMQDLQTRLATLNEEAKKIRSVHMPSAEQRTRLNDINTERNQIVGQQMALMSKHAANLREGAEKIATEQAAKAQAEAAQNSSAEDTIRLPGIGDKTRSQFVQEYLQRHEGATEAEANEMFEKRAAETGGYVKKGNVENGQNQQNASADEGRNSLGNEADGGENRTGRPGQPTEVQRQRLESSSQLLSRDGEEAARVEKGAALTDGRSLDLLVDKYEELEDFVQTLYDLGFDRVTLVTDGQMLDPKGDRIPALFYKGELFLSLDYGEPGKYDYKSYAKHEVGHLKLEQLRRFFGDKKSAWFVSNAVQALTESPEEYASLFKKYANMYRAYKMIDGISDEEFVNMVNEEILCDMLGGLHGLERFIDKADAYLEQSNFNTVTSNIQKGERLPGQLQVVDALKESEMPYNTPVTTLMSTANVDAPNTTVVPADQVSRMAYYGLMNALGFFVNKSKEDVKEGRQALKRGEHAAYWSKEDAEAKQNPVRIDMNNEEDREKMLQQVYNSPVGEMIRYAENNGFLSEDPEEAARIANAEYELFARIGAITDETRDFYMSMQFIGSALFTAMKLNADKQYNTTYDPNSVCTKTQAIIDDMSAQMVDLKRGLYQSEILEIYRSQFEAGNPVTCPECYVFTHWVGIGGLLEKIYKYQNKYAAMSPEEVVKEYKQLYNDVTDELNDKVKPLKEELANPNTTPERAAEIQQLLKKNTFGKTRSRLIKEANDGLPKIREKIEKGQTLTETELKNQKKWERHEGSLEALSWLEKVYFDGKAKDGKAKASDANITVDPETGEKTFGFVVPPDILFDLNRGEEFAAGYKGAWAFRTTQGAGYGKAIAPYAEVTLGEGILVTKSKDAIKQKMEAELNQLFLTERGEIDANKAKKGTRAEALKLARKKQLNQLFIGGQRLQSTSDTRYDNASDYLLIALEMQTMHGGVQVYTKVPGAVHFFELCGMCTNMSLMPKGGGLEMVDEQLVPVDTATGGMNPDVARQLREDNPHAGTITIGVNDRHIRAMMNQFFRDFIIPYHASGGNADLIARFRAIQEGKSPAGATMPKSTDYTKTQNDKILSDAILANDAMYRHSLGKEATFEPEEIADIHDFRRARLYLLTKLSDDIKAGREAPSGLERMWTTVGIQENDPRYRSHLILQNLYRSLTEGKWQGVKLSKDIVEGQIFPNEFWDTSVNYQNSSENTENYLAYCEALGFMHRFSGQGVAMKKVTRADGSYVVRNTNVPIKGTTYDGNETMLTDLAYQVTYDKNSEAHYVIDEEGKRVIEPYFWKVLTDRRMYDNDGNYLEQPYVSLEGLVGTGSEEDIARGVASVASKTEGIAHNMGERAYNRPRSLATANVPVGERMRNRFFEEAKKLSETNRGAKPMEIKRSKNVKRYALAMDDPGYETSKKEAPVTDNRSPKQKLYVEPTSDAWAVARDADGSLLNTDYIKNELGLPIYDNPKDAYKAPEKAEVIPPKHRTSNSSTEDTYTRLFGGELKKSEGTVKGYIPTEYGEDGKKKLLIVDASSGMGLGANLGKQTIGENNVIDLEPYPGERPADMPTDYESYGSLVYDMENPENRDGQKVNRKADFIISNAVINVMAQDAREEHLAALLRMMDDNGTIFINPAFPKTWGAYNKAIPLEEYKQRKANGEDVSKLNVILSPATDTTGGEIYTAQSKSVQKGYTPSEFKAFAKDLAKQVLGYDVEVTSASGKGDLATGYLIRRADKPATRYALSPDQQKNQDFNNQQTEVGSRLKTLQGTNIQRYKGIAGKEVAPQVYVHKNYASQVVPEDVLNRAEEVLNEKYPDFQYNTIMYDKKTGNIRFDEAPDFDTAREPIAGNTVTVKPNGETKTGYSDSIWHHKWLWVGNDYKGFDVADSWNWSKQWLNTIRPVDVSEHKFNSSFSQRGIANGTGHGTTNWNEQLEYFGLPKDENATPTQTRYAIGDEAAQQNFERLKGALNNVFSTDNSERTAGNGERELAERIERSYSADSITDAEDRRAVAEAIRRAGGLTAEEIDDSWGNVLSTEVVSPEYYTKEMLGIEAANKEHGLQTKFFSGSVTIDGEDLNMAGFADTDRGVAYIKMDAVNRKDNDVTKNSFIDTAPIAALSGVNSASINGRHERLHLLKDASDANAQALFDFVNSTRGLDEINFWYQRKLRQGGYEFDDYSEEMAADLYAGALKLADKGLQKKADRMIAKIDSGTRHGSRYAIGGNVGYHAGDLGKAEYLSQQGYSRGTGHFGTGTYFVGEEEKVTKDSYYGKRPQHAVDFSDYNLYKVRNDRDGYRLHDALKIIDGGINREWIAPAVKGDLRIINPTGYYDLAQRKFGEEWPLDDNLLNAQLEYAKENGIDLQSWEEYKADEGKGLDEEGLEDLKYYYEDYVEETLKKEIKAVNDDYDEFQDAVFHLNLLTGLRDTKILSALQAVADYQDATPRLSKSDSYATVFMKAMGYDGVDVRDTGLDNTTYGSVIYDVKPETVRYAVGDEESTTSSNPYPENTLEHDFLAVLQNGDPEALGKWVTEQLDLNKQAEENAKIRPPVIPTKGFVPRITPQQKEALETKRKGLIQKKGAMRPSEKNANGFQMPTRDENNNPFRRNIQNVGSAKQIPQDAVDQLENFAFTDIHATYVPDSNKEMIANAKREINETGDLEVSKAQFQKLARDSYDHNVSAQDIAFGEQLLIETSRSGDLNGFLDTLASLVEISTTAGKTLQAFRMLKQSGPIGQLYYMEKVVKRLNNNMLKQGYNKQVSIDPDLAQAVLDAETDVERDEALDVLKASIAKDLPVTFKEKLDAWRYLAMLGNARTHVRNVIGNAFFVPFRYAKDLMSAGGEYLASQLGWIQQEDRTKAVRIQKEWKTFAKEQAEVWKKELQGNGKYNPAREILEARKVLPGFLDKLSRINGDYLEKEDWAFLRPAFTRALAMALQNTGYSVDEIRTSNDKEVRQAYNRAIKIAIEEAQKATYRDFSATASAINRLKRLETGNKVGRFAGVLLEGVLPFTKTPINILKRGIEYSPIGLATSIANAVDNAIRHNGDAVQIIDSIAAGATGSIVMMLGWLLTRMGCLRGKRQDDKEEQFEKLQGYQDYSLQFGDASFTIDWAAPIALPLFAGSALAEFMENSDDFEITDAWNAVMMIAEPMTSLSMLSGLNDTLSSASYADDNQKLVTIGKSMLSSYLGQFFPTIAGQFARSIDGTRRQTYVDKNSKIPPAMQRFIQSSIQNKTPVWESQKAPYVDQWGRQSTTSTKLLNAAENFFAPWYRSVINTTDIDEQLQALYDSKDVSEDNHKYILPKSPEKGFKINGQDKFLTADEYVSFATDVGTTKYKLLTSLLSDARYLNLTDDQKALAVKYIYDYATAAGKYHIAPDFNIHRAGKWIEEAEAAKSDYERFEIIWDKIEAAFDK